MITLKFLGAAITRMEFLGVQRWPLPRYTCGRYEIRSKLAAGGMAEVYLARDLEIGREVFIGEKVAD